jgi:hypothetical protein
MTGSGELWRGGSTDRQAALPAPLRDLHRAVLRRFLDTGTPPTERWIRHAAAERGLGDSAVGDLAAADLVHVANGVAAVAYPFSGRPTAGFLPCTRCAPSTRSASRPWPGETAGSPPPTRTTARRIAVGEPATSGGYMRGDLRPYWLGLLRIRD